MLEKHGFETELERHLNQSAGTTLHVTGPQNVTSGIAVVLSEEHLGRKVQKLFSKEMQVGDDAFDREVFVQYAEAEDVHALRDPTVQTLVLQLVKIGELSITENHAKVHIRSHTATPVNEIYAALAMVVTALDRVRMELT